MVHTRPLTTFETQSSPHNSTSPTHNSETHNSPSLQFSDTAIQDTQTVPEKITPKRNNKKNTTTHETWNIIYSNVRGLKSKLNSINQILLDQQPHLLLITETQLRSNIGMSSFFNGYEFYSRKREGKVGGGVAALVRNDVRSNIAVHIPQRTIESLWVSVRRKNAKPLMIGVYYGKQESRTTKDEIEKEYLLLQEEIQEMKCDGDILLTMDANAKIGLLGENPSPFGNKLMKVFNETDLTIMNRSDKCKGKVTRANTKNATEVSAIDFVVANDPVCEWIKKMEIDETGLYKIRGKNESDHHTILLTVDIPHIDKKQSIKKCGWNLRADDTKWDQFKNEIRKCQPKTKEILNNSEFNMNEKYKKFYNQIETAARKTIGKSTFKENKVQTSKEIKALQIEKRTTQPPQPLQPPQPQRQQQSEEIAELREQMANFIQEVRTTMNSNARPPSHQARE